MEDRFRHVKADFDRMTRRYREGEISWREYVEGLKQMRFKDEAGRFWMIGAQTGLWYYYDGAGWVQSPPPTLGERKAICIYCGYENDIEASACAGCGGRVSGAPEEACPVCGGPLDPESGACPACASTAAPVPGDAADAARPAAKPGEAVLIHSIHPLSVLWLWGGLGLVAGVLFGLIAGGTEFLPGVAEALPVAFKDMQGKLLGGMVYAGLGGLAGFVLLGAAGFALALVANAVLSVSGGLKIRIARSAPSRGEERD